MPPRFRTAILCIFLVFAPSFAGAAAAQGERRCEPRTAGATDTERFAERGDATLFDAALALQWKRCSEGQEWVGETARCRGSAGVYNWHQALAYADEARFAGQDDWRLPSRDELRSILAVGCGSPTIDLTLFPDTPAFPYWSGTPFEYFIRLAWAVYFNSGKVGYSPKDYAFFHIRLVRDAGGSAPAEGTRGTEAPPPIDRAAQ